MPSDLIGRFEQQRPVLLRQMTADLALPDDKPAAALLDGHLLPMLKSMEAARPPVVFLVCTKDELKRLLRDGLWQDPRFHFNRVADEVVYNDSMFLSFEQEMDDMVVPVIYKAAMTEAQRQETLVRIVRGTEWGIADEIAVRSQFLLQMGFVRFIMEDVMKPLKLRPDQQWFSIGSAGVLSSKYAGPVMGIPAGELNDRLIWEHPRNPVKAAAIDLLHPMDLKDLRPQYVPLYVEAVRRKSMKVVLDWTAGGNDNFIPRTLTALRKQTPADGTGLMKRVQELTGKDLSGALSAQ